MSKGILPILIEERGDPADEKDLVELEEALANPLPDDFRAFLLEGDGIVLNAPNYIRSTYYFALSELFGAGDLGPTERSLLGMYQTYEGRVPPEFLPILGDANGNLFCLGVAGDQRGEVWAWDQEGEVLNGPPSLTNMHILAPTFDDFLGELKA